jgi:hypothetical protein
LPILKQKLWYLLFMIKYVLLFYIYQ